MKSNMYHIHCTNNNNNNNNNNNDNDDDKNDDNDNDDDYESNDSNDNIYDINDYNANTIQYNTIIMYLLNNVVPKNIPEKSNIKQKIPKHKAPIDVFMIMIMIMIMIIIINIYIIIYIPDMQLFFLYLKHYQIMISQYYSVYLKILITMLLNVL